jgi:hypothetical protein
LYSSMSYSTAACASASSNCTLYLLLYLSMQHCNNFTIKWQNTRVYNCSSYIVHRGTNKNSLCLTKHHAMKIYWRVEVWLHTFFDLGTRWRWVVSFAPWLLYLRERAPSMHCIR